MNYSHEYFIRHLKINLKSFIICLLKVGLDLFKYFLRFITHFSFINAGLNYICSCKALSDLNKAICSLIDLIKQFVWFKYQLSIREHFQALNLCELLYIFYLKNQDPSLLVWLFTSLNPEAILCSHIFLKPQEGWLQEFRIPCRSGFHMAPCRGMNWEDLIHECRLDQNWYDLVHMFWEI